MTAPDDDFTSEDQEEPKGRSEVALEIERLKRASFKTAATREKIPQPLFWSLFGHALRSIRGRKERERAMRELLYGPLE